MRHVDFQSDLDVINLDPSSPVTDSKPITPP